MNIGWLNDYKLSEFLGGAGITNEIMMKKGKELGHTITEVTYTDKTIQDKTKHKEWFKKLKEFDILILNNVNAFPVEIINFVINECKYVKYEHDYSFCEKRSMMCERCDHKGKCEISPIFIKLYSNSLLNIFLSPLHLETHKKFLGPTMRDAIFIPSPLEQGKFYPPAQKTKDYLFAGIMMGHKGIHQILDYADKKLIKIDFAGKVISKNVLKRIKEKHNYLGEVPFEKMPELYRQYKYFIINPLWPEPFGRTISEALASGCKLIKFEKSNITGYESYNLPPVEMRKKCFEAPTKFWKKIREVV